MTADSNTATLTGTHGRDAGKTFEVHEVPPIELATFILRLLGAIRLDGVDELRSLMDPPEGVDEIQAVLRLLAGSDAQAVRALMTDALSYVRVAPDPQHPGMFRTLRDDDIKELKTLGYVRVAPDPQHPGMFRTLRDDDIKELKTLGQVLGVFVRTNVAPGL